MAKRVYICFDFDHDRRYAFLLKAMSENPNFDISFKDGTPQEIKSDDVGRIRAALSQKIREASHTLVIIGKHANDRHADNARIGALNWQHWEIEKSIAEGNKLVGVKIERLCASPTPLLNAGASFAHSYTEDSIATAIQNA